MALTEFVADLHVHFYPCFNLKQALDGAQAALANACPSAQVKLLALTERHDCNYFEQLKAGRYRLAEVQYEFEPCADGLALEAIARDNSKLILVAGRQIISKEKVEVLALAMSEVIKDGLPVTELLAAIRDAGGVPVINWAPGKWFFKRGRIVEELIEKCQTGDLLLGDTSLRPEIWKEPRLMQKGKAKQLKIIRGSDPLPVAGEEKLIGSHGVSFKADYDAERPALSLRDALLNSKVELVHFGRQPELLPTLQRLKENEFQRRGIKRQASAGASSDTSLNQAQ